MTFRACLFAAFATVFTALPSSAAFIYNNQASFTAAINAGTAFTNTFDTSAGAPNYSANGFAYTLSAAPVNSLYFSNNPAGPSGAFVGTANPTDSLIVTFTSGNVSAVGGNFFQTNVSDVFVPATITVNLSDGTSDTFLPAGINSFRGYTTSPGVFITTLTLPGWNGVGVQTFASMDNFVVGQALAPSAEAVPVPATALIGLAAVPVLGVIRRRRG